MFRRALVVISDLQRRLSSRVCISRAQPNASRYRRSKLTQADRIDLVHRGKEDGGSQILEEHCQG